jgi:hypothetical protein
MKTTNGTDLAKAGNKMITEIKNSRNENDLRNALDLINCTKDDIGKALSLFPESKVLLMLYKTLSFSIRNSESLGSDLPLPIKTHLKDIFSEIFENRSSNKK